MKIRLIVKVLIWLALFVNTNKLAGQNYTDPYFEIRDNTEGAARKFKIDSLLNLIDPKTNLPVFAGISADFAVLLSQNGQQVDALFYGKLAVEQLELYGKPNPLYINALSNLGRFYFFNAQYGEAISTYEKIISNNEASHSIADTYAQMGTCYMLMNDPFRSISYLEKGLSLLAEQARHDLIAIQLLNLAEAYRYLGDEASMNKRLQLLIKSDSLDKHFPLDAYNKRSLFIALGNQFITEHHYDFDKANYYYRLNLKASRASIDSSNMALAYNNLSYLYNLERRDSATFFIEQGLKYSKDREIKARLFDNLSHHQLNKENYPLALDAINKAINTNLGSDIKATQSPDSYQLSNAINQTHALYCLKEKAKIFLKLFEAQKDRNHLQVALNQVKAADVLLGFIDGTANDSKTRLFWRKEASQVYMLGAFTAHLMNAPEQAFYFMEKNKAVLLAQEVLKNKAYANLPKHVSERKVALQKNMLLLESQSNVAKDSLFEAKLQYQNYIDSISSIFTDHFERKFELPIIPLTDAQNSLGERDLIISYIWNQTDEVDEKVVGIATSQNSSYTFLIREAHQLDSLLSAYQGFLKSPFNTAKDKQDFLQVANRLFQSVFSSAELRKAVEDKNLFIMADGNLQRIPFEALVVNRETEEYLLTKSDVSYLYSWSFQTYNQHIRHQTDQPFIGYSPSNFEALNLSSLPGSVQELESVSKLMNGDTRTGTNASKEHFLSQSTDYQVIHLATHASAESNPWIAFADEKLTLPELYTYRNNAELVTLSACNTLTGEIAEGEGIISLSRGFFYAGAKSVVSSLWSVNDKTTQQIMADFYANLRSGENKSEALNNAKRKYLETNSLSDLSPYYWSSFILVGDVRPLPMGQPDYAYLLILLVLLSVILIAARKKNKS